MKVIIIKCNEVGSHGTTVLYHSVEIWWIKRDIPNYDHKCN